MEFKKDELNEKAETALVQIKNKKHDVDIYDLGIREIYRYGYKLYGERLLYFKRLN
jgi:hypothetical protein